MASRNDITGDLIKTKTTSDDKYAEGWDRIFGKKRNTDTSSDSGHSADSQCNPPLVNPNCDICGKELNKVGECAWTSCPLNWDEARQDTIGQNGNDGEHYGSSDV